MKVLVTGASGFLGSKVVELLSRSNDYEEIRAFVRKSSNVDAIAHLKKVKLYYGSLDNVRSIKNAIEGVEVVIHCAAKVTDWVIINILFLV